MERICFDTVKATLGCWLRADRREREQRQERDLPAASAAADRLHERSFFFLSYQQLQVSASVRLKLPSDHPVARQSSREVLAPLECRPPRRSSRRFSLFPAAPPASTLTKFPSGFYQPKNYQDVVPSCSYSDLSRDADSIHDGSIPSVPAGTVNRGLSALIQPCEALSGGSRRWDLLWEVETDVGGALRDASRAPGCYASGGPSGVFEFVKEKQKDGDCGDVEDSMNVDDLSELLTHIEAQEEDEGVDFSVFIEDEDALNVEEISDVFSALEDVAGDLLPPSSDSSSSSEAQLTWQEDEDALNVDAVSELFTSLEQADAEEERSVSEEDVCDAANVDEVSDLFSSLEECSADDDEASEAFQAETDREDAANVDSMADVFSALEDSTCSGGDGVDNPAQIDWIDSLEVDNMSSLFSEMERKSVVVQQQQPPVVAVPQPSVPAVKVDSRIFVPKFSVRIEGRAAAATGRVQPTPLVHLGSSSVSSSASSSSSRLLAGPPVFLAGPPQLFAANSLSREDRVERWKEKRKARSFVPREPDAVVSDTRRACAAKRQRVKGRFTSEKSAFVSITALQN